MFQINEVNVPDNAEFASVRIKAAMSKHSVNLTLQQNRKITFHKCENAVRVYAFAQEIHMLSLITFIVY